MKEIIQNRKSQKIVVDIEPNSSAHGLVFIMHGLGGFKEQPHLQAIAEAFLEHEYTVVRFDTTNTFGESGGDYSEATTTNYYEDLEDIIHWARAQSWYREPFVLAGHSIGGLCIGLFAEKYPEKVKGLAPISTVVSGTLSWEAKEQSGELAEWKRTGWRITPSSKPGIEKRLKWSHMEDRLQYDLLLEVNKLTMPVLLIVGEKDDSSPLQYQQILYEQLPGKKELHVIKDGPHTFKDSVQLEEIKSIFRSWISSF